MCILLLFLKSLFPIIYFLLSYYYAQNKKSLANNVFKPYFILIYRRYWIIDILTTDAPTRLSNICMAASAKARPDTVKAAANVQPSSSKIVTYTSIWDLGYKCWKKKLVCSWLLPHFCVLSRELTKLNGRNTNLLLSWELGLGY